MGDLQFWSDWDGRGADGALAWCLGWVDLAVSRETLKEIRMLGMTPRSVRLEHGWVGTVGEDLVYDACDDEMQSLAAPGFYVDEDTFVRVTFAYEEQDTD